MACKNKEINFVDFATEICIILLQVNYLCSIPVLKMLNYFPIWQTFKTDPMHLSIYWIPLLHPDIIVSDDSHINFQSQSVDIVFLFRSSNHIRSIQWNNKQIIKKKLFKPSSSLDSIEDCDIYMDMMNELNKKNLHLALKNTHTQCSVSDTMYTATLLS